jgi:molybdate transport system regulatory protein
VSQTRLTLRVDLSSRCSVGPGKIRLLEEIGRTGSISQAGRNLRMSYRRAWLLIDDMNKCFRHAVVSAKSGGLQGGGAALTEFGAGLVRNYRTIETAASNAAASRLRDLETALRAPKLAPKRASATQSRRLSMHLRTR